LPGLEAVVEDMEEPMASLGVEEAVREDTVL
jgi:hypothetical protein